MDSSAKFKVAIVLGIVILAVDLLWLYGSVSSYGALGGRIPYHNYTGNASTTYPNYNGTRVGFHAGGYPGFIDIIYGVVILIADVIWLYLEFSTARVSTKKK